MTSSLFRKELRSLVPFIGLVLFFNLLTWCDILFTEFPDQYSLSKLLEWDDEPVFMAVVGFALAAIFLLTG